MTAVTAEDIRKIIKDEVPAIVAERMLAAEEAAREAAAKKQTSAPASISEMLVKDNQSANERTASVIKSKGDRMLNVGRALLVLSAAAQSKRSVKDVLDAAARNNPAFAGEELRALTQSAFSGAGGVLPQEMSADFIEMLYARSILDGANRVQFAGSIDLGKQTGSAVAYYASETANVTPSAPSVGSLTLKGRALYALVAVSNQLLNNRLGNVEQMVVQDLVRVMALKKDLQALRGVGSEGSPKGIKNLMASANANAQSGTTLAAKIADITKMLSLIDTTDVGLDGVVLAMSPRVKWNLFSTVDSNGNQPFAAMLSAGNLYGFQVRTSTQIPNNLGGGTESEVYAIKLSEILDGEDVNVPVSVEVFPNGAFHDGSNVVSGISTNQTPIRAQLSHDVGMRHTGSAAMITGVTWGA